MRLTKILKTGENKPFKLIDTSKNQEIGEFKIVGDTLINLTNNNSDPYFTYEIRSSHPTRFVVIEQLELI